MKFAQNIRIKIGSAVDKIENRPVFYNLVDSELKKDDLLLIISVDRCSRNTFELLKLRQQLGKKGIKFISLDLPSVNFD